MALRFSKAKWAIGRKKIDLQVDTVAIILVLSNSSAPDEEAAEIIDEFTTLDEYNGAGYRGKLLNGKALTRDTVNDVARLTADDIVLTALGAGTRACVGAILVHVVTDESDSRPIAFIDGTALPFAGDGQDRFWNWHVDGVLVIGQFGFEHCNPPASLPEMDGAITLDQCPR